MAKPFPQGADPGEEFRDNDIMGLYKPDDTPSAVDGSLNKSKTIGDLKTMIEDEVINTNTANIATNSSDITALEGRATVNENDIDALEVRATTNEGDIYSLEGKVGQSLNTDNAVTFASVTTNNVAIKHKLFTELTADAQGKISVAHDLDNLKIRDVSVNGYGGTKNYGVGADMAWSAQSSTIDIEGLLDTRTYNVLVTYEA